MTNGHVRCIEGRLLSHGIDDREMVEVRVTGGEAQNVDTVSSRVS